MRLFLLGLLLFSSCVMAQSPDFLAGVSAYQKKDFKASQNIFTGLLKEHPENPQILYNLGLAEFQLGNVGLALGLWRKARFLDGGFKEVKLAIDFVEEGLNNAPAAAPLPAQVLSALIKLPLSFWMGLCLFSFFAFCFFAIDWRVKKKISLLQWPWWSLSLIPVILLSLALTLHMLIDRRHLRATVIEKDLLTHTNPSDTSPTLSQLSEGQIVQVEKSFGQWVQIRTLDGAPGWVPQNSLIAIGR